MIKHYIAIVYWHVKSLHHPWQRHVLNINSTFEAIFFFKTVIWLTESQTSDHSYGIFETHQRLILWISNEMTYYIRSLSITYRHYNGKLHGSRNIFQIQIWELFYFLFIYWCYSYYSDVVLIPKYWRQVLVSVALFRQLHIKREPTSFVLKYIGRITYLVYPCQARFPFYKMTAFRDAYSIGSLMRPCNM